MTWFGLFLLLYLLATLLFKYWVVLRHIHSNASRFRVPDKNISFTSADEFRSTLNYEIKLCYFGLTSVTYMLGILLFMTLGGGIAWLHQLFIKSQIDPVFTGVIFVWSIIGLYYCLNLPLDLYDFLLNKKYQRASIPPNYSFTKYQVFFVLKALIIGTPLLWLALWTMQHAPDIWWLLTWFILVTTLLVKLWVYPLFIAPLYHPLHTIANEKLAGKIVALCESHNLPVKAVMSAKLTSSGLDKMIFFSGIGKSRILIISEKLLDLTTGSAEVLTLVTYIVAQHKLRAALKNFLALSLLSLLVLLVMGKVVTAQWFLTALQLPDAVPTHVTFVAMALMLPVLWELLRPAAAILKQSLVLRADQFVVKNIDDDDYVSALNKINHPSKASVPSPLYSIIFEDEPSIALRINTIAKSNGDQP